MKGIIGFCAISALLFGAGSASAAKLSGAYAFASTEMCEAQLSVVKDGMGKVTDVTLTRAGMMSGGNGIITFTPTSASGGTLETTSATLIEGGALRVGGNGFNWSQKSDNQSGTPYSFTATTFTFGSGPGAQVYRMVCGNVAASGACGSVFLLRRDSVPGNPDCVNAVSAVKR